MENFVQINGASVATWFVAFVVLCIVIIIFLGGKERSTRYFSLVAIITAIWTTMMGLHIAYPLSGIDAGTGYYLDSIPRIMHALGLVIGFFFFHFCYVFPENKKAPQILSLVLFVLVTCFTILIFFTDLVVGDHVALVDTISILGGNKWTWELGPLIWTYASSFSLLFGGGLGLLILKQREMEDLQKRLNIRRMIVPLALGVSIPGIADIVLPFLFNNFSFNWMAGIAQIFWVMVLGHAVIKYNQMNVRYVLAELLILVVMGLLFISIFI